MTRTRAFFALFFQTAAATRTGFCIGGDVLFARRGAPDRGGPTVWAYLDTGTRPARDFPLPLVPRSERLQEAPTMMDVSRCSTVAWLRPCRVLLCLVVIVFNSSTLFAQTPRLELLQAMLQRPTDPWPRGQGHVLLAVPGCSEAAKGYHEPG